MSEVVVVFRETDENNKRIMVRYANVNSIAPFGNDGIYLDADDGALILPMGRVREIFVPRSADDGEEQQIVTE